MTAGQTPGGGPAPDARTAADAGPGGAGPALVYSGKVREVYRMADGILLIVASDRISAFDHVLATPIPDKGAVLTQLSLWWFERLADIVPNHLVEAPIPPQFEGRAMACRELSMLPVECVARGYLAGSGWLDYQRDGAICGVPLPPGLVEADRLPEPVFTPATKAPRGQHDENIPSSAVADLVGADTAAEIERITLAVYRRGVEVAARAGIIVADTKIELGLDPAGRMLLADEVLTPDSSRFWPAGQWRPGRPQPSFDKQYVRDWLISGESGWDPRGGQAPPPLPQHVVERTRTLYIAAYERITGRRWT